MGRMRVKIQELVEALMSRLNRQWKIVAHRLLWRNEQRFLPQ